MAQATAGDNVKVHYKGSLDDGSVFDSSEGREPLAFQVGSGQVIKGFDIAVTGLAVGESKTVRIEPEDAYGPVQEGLTMEVPKDELPEGMPMELGMQLQAQDPNGQMVVLSLVEVKENTVILDGNHELAGKALTFEVELVEIG